MEQHTYKPKTFNTHFYCFQPIDLSVNILPDLFEVKTSHINWENIGSDDYDTKWLTDFTNLNNIYHSILNVKFEKYVEVNKLIDELQVNFKVNKQYELSTMLNINNTKYYLLFDYRLMYFILVYEISFDVPIENTKLLDIDNLSQKSDFYNTVRNMLVKENDDSVISKWAIEIKEQVQKKIYSILENEFNFSIKSTDINISNNSGNITNVVNMYDIVDNNSENIQLSYQIIKLNNSAERLTNNIKPIIIENPSDLNFNQLYNFNGRFHTIILNNNNDLYRYIPIQFHMQYMWFYLKQLNIILENEYNKLISNSESINKLEQHVDTIDNYINKVEILTMHNENFKLAIEVDNELIYQNIQQRWNIEDKLKNSNKYISFFKDYLIRLYSKKTSKVEQRQNKILFIISIVQLITLLSVWNDYITLFNNSFDLHSSFVDGRLYSGWNILSTFGTLILPLAILVTICIIYFMVTRRN